MNKVYWMIEKNINGQAHWWMSKNGDNGEWDDVRRWTTDPNKARHFDSKADADFAIGSEHNEAFLVDCVATEHVFMDR